MIRLWWHRRFHGTRRMYGWEPITAYENAVIWELQTEVCKCGRTWSHGKKMRILR